MFTYQKNTLRKATEVVLVMLLLLLIDSQMERSMIDLQPGPFAFILIIFTLMYGGYVGFFALGLVLLYTTTASLLGGSDILLLFFDIEKVKWLGFYLALTIVCSLFHHIFSQRLDQLSSQKDDAEATVQDQSSQIRTLTNTNEKLKKKLLTFHDTPQTLYHMLLRINRPSESEILDSLLAITSDYFRTETGSIYNLEQKKSRLSLSQFLPQQGEQPTLRHFSDAPSFYQRLLHQKSVTRKTQDSDLSPMFAGRISVHGTFDYVLVIEHLPVENLNDYDMQLLEQLLEWTAHCLEQNVYTDKQILLNDAMKKG